jgi:small subunit ribosomal protein S6
MQTYETLFVTAPTLTDEDEQAVVDGLSRVVSDLGGVMVAHERLGRRRLAYPILKHNEGVYVRFLYDSEAAVPHELERRIRLSDKVLRSLTVRMDGNWATFSKEQAVRDAQARVEEAEREAREAEEHARRVAEGGEPLGDEGPSDADEDRDAEATED